VNVVSVCHGLHQWRSTDVAGRLLLQFQLPRLLVIWFGRRHGRAEHSNRPDNDNAFDELVHRFISFRVGGLRCGIAEALRQAAWTSLRDDSHSGE
jgi:hypothetical protein